MFSIDQINTLLELVSLASVHKYTCGPSVTPHLYTHLYSIFKVISMFGKSKTATGAEDADRILQMFIGLYEKEKQSVKKDEEKFSLEPGTGHFVSVLLAYQKRRLNVSSAVQRMEELLLQMETLHGTGNDKIQPNYQVSDKCGSYYCHYPRLKRFYSLILTFVLSALLSTSMHLQSLDFLRKQNKCSLELSLPL